MNPTTTRLGRLISLAGTANAAASFTFAQRLAHADGVARGDVVRPGLGA